MLLWLTHRRFCMFLPNLNSHSSNRLFLLFLSFLLFAAIATHSHPQRSPHNSHDGRHNILSRMTRLFQPHA
jgi:hypothetical protein